MYGVFLCDAFGLSWGGDDSGGGFGGGGGGGGGGWVGFGGGGGVGWGGGGGGGGRWAALTVITYSRASFLLDSVTVGQCRLTPY